MAPTKEGEREKPLPTANTLKVVKDTHFKKIIQKQTTTNQHYTWSGKKGTITKNNTYKKDK